MRRRGPVRRRRGVRTAPCRPRSTGRTRVPGSEGPPRPRSAAARASPVPAPRSPWPGASAPLLCHAAKRACPCHGGSAPVPPTGACGCVGASSPWLCPRPRSCPCRIGRGARNPEIPTPPWSPEAPLRRTMQRTRRTRRTRTAQTGPKGGSCPALRSRTRGRRGIREPRRLREACRNGGTTPWHIRGHLVLCSCAPCSCSRVPARGSSPHRTAPCITSGCFQRAPPPPEARPAQHPRYALASVRVPMRAPVLMPIPMPGMDIRTLERGGRLPPPRKPPTTA